MSYQNLDSSKVQPASMDDSQPDIVLGQILDAGFQKTPQEVA